MALVKCPECSKEISNTATKCPHCGVNTKRVWKQQEQAEKNQKALEEWNNMTPSQKKWGIIVFVVIAIVVIFLIAKGFSNDIDHNDDKCDICKKTAYSSISGEEFCYEHWKDVIDYYLDD